jgi:hypothetical protein
MQQQTQQQHQQNIYGNALINDLHTHFPAFLYDPNRFQNIGDVLMYVQDQMRNRFDVFSNQQRLYQQAHPPPFHSSPYTPIRQRRARSPPPPTAAPPPLQSRMGRPPPVTIPEYNEDAPLSDSEILETLLTNTIQRLIQNPNSQQPALAPILYYTTTLPQTGSFMDPVPVPLTTAQLSQNTTVETLTVDSEQECAVCRDTMLTGATVRKITGCGHLFHRSCIDVWFQSNVRCPNCRYDVRSLNTNTV